MAGCSMADSMQAGVQAVFLIVALGLVLYHYRSHQRYQAKGECCDRHQGAVVAWVILVFILGSVAWSLIPAARGSRLMEKRLDVEGQESAGEFTDTSLARVRLFVSNFLLQLQRTEPDSKQVGILAGYSNRAGLKLPSIYNLADSTNRSDLFVLKTRDDGSLEIQSSPDLAATTRLLLVSSKNSKGVIPKPYPETSVPDKIAEEDPPSCDESAPYLKHLERSDVKGNFLYLYVYRCRGNSARPRASLAFYRPKLDSPFVSVCPRRWSDDYRKWIRHQLSVSRGTFIYLGALGEGVLPGTTVVEVPAPRDRMGLLMPPHRILSCTDWENINAADSTGFFWWQGQRYKKMRVERGGDENTCHVAVGPFMLELKMLQPHMAGVGWRTLWIAMLFLLPLSLALIVFCWGRTFGNDDRIILQANGIALASVLLHALFQYRLLWAHRLDYLNPRYFSAEGGNTWINKGLVVAVAVVLLVGLIPLIRTMLSNGSQAQRRHRWLWAIPLLTFMLGFIALGDGLGSSTVLQKTIANGLLAVVLGCTILLTTLNARPDETKKSKSLLEKISDFLRNISNRFWSSKLSLSEQVSKELNDQPSKGSFHSLPRGVQLSILTAGIITLFLVPILLKALGNPGRSLSLPLGYFAIGLSSVLWFGVLRSFFIMAENWNKENRRRVFYWVLMLGWTLWCFRSRSRSVWLPDMGMLIAYGGWGFIIGGLVTSLHFVWEGERENRSTQSKSRMLRGVVVVPLLLLATLILVLASVHLDTPLTGAERTSKGAITGLVLVVMVSLVITWFSTRQRKQRTGWSKYLLAGVVPFAAPAAVICFLFFLTPQIALTSPVGAQRLSLIYEPWLAALRNPHSQAQSLAAWTELHPAERAEEESLHGQGYFGADIHEAGTRRSLNNDYLPVLLLREAGRSGLCASVLLVLLLLGAAWVGALSHPPGSLRRCGGQILAGMLTGLAVYQPLAVIGVFPFTGIPLPGLGIDSWADTWMLVIVVILTLAVRTRTGKDASRPSGEGTRRFGVAVAASILAFALTATILWVLSTLALNRSKEFIKEDAAGLRLDPFRGVGSATQGEVFDMLDTLRGNVTVLYRPKSERSLPGLLPESPPVKNPAIERWLAAWMDNYRDTASQAERIATSNCRKSDQVDFWSFEDEGNTCLATYRFGWPAYQIRIPKDESKRGRLGWLDLSSPIARYINLSNVTFTPPTRYRVISQPDGLAKSDLAELTSRNIVVRIRPGEDPLELFSDGALKTGYLVAGSVDIGRSLLLHARKGRQGERELVISPHKKQAKRRAAMVLEYCPGGPVIRTRSDGTGGWKSSELVGEKVVDKLTIVVLPWAAEERPLWIIRPRTRKEDGSEAPAGTVLADDIRIFPDKAKRIYPFGSAIPELGWRGPTPHTSYGLDGWLGAFLSQPELSDRSATKLARAFSNDHCRRCRRIAGRGTSGCPAQAPTQEQAGKKSGLKSTSWIDTLCPRSPLDKVRECMVSLQPELHVHMRHLLEMTARQPDVFRTDTRHRWPARRAAFALLDGNTGEILAQATYVAGRETSAFAPRNASRREGLRWVLEAESFRNSLKRRLKVCRKKDVYNVGCIAEILEPCASAKQPCTPWSRRMDKWLPYVLSSLCQNSGECHEDFQALSSRLRELDDSNLKEFMDALLNFDTHGKATQAGWADPPVAIGSTLKPLIARAAEMADRELANALVLAPGGVCGNVYGHNPPTAIWSGFQGNTDMVEFLTRSLNWFQASIGLLLPSFGGGFVGNSPDGKQKLSSALFTRGHGIYNPKWCTGKLQVWNQANKEVINRRSRLNLEALADSKAWQNFEALMGRRLCESADTETCIKAHAYGDLCAARRAPLRYPTNSLRSQVAIGDSAIIISEKGGTSDSVHIKPYFNFLRGSGDRPLTTVLQLADAFMRLVFDQERHTKFAAWFPPHHEKKLQQDTSRQKLPDCYSSDWETLESKVSRGMCGLIRKSGGTARTAFRRRPPPTGIIVHAAKTGTINSLKETKKQCDQDEKLYKFGGQTEEDWKTGYSLCDRNGKKRHYDDSLFVTAFSVKNGKETKPFVLALWYQGMGKSGYAAQVVSFFYRLVRDYYTTDTGPTN